jgi:ammonium transporter, Amt family
MDKIRKEYPEFEMVDDRQLSQIMYLYDINIKSPIRPSSVALIIQGTFFLWICWLFYNISPSNGITQNKMKNMPSRIVMNTILSSASSCVSVLFFGPLVSWGKQDPTNKYPVQQTCNSLLVGLVSITGCCNNVQPWAAIIIGSIGTLIYCLSCKLFEKLKIDDPLESS